MKRLLLFIALSFTTIGAWAQSSPAEAKAAYLLAEEEFSAGKYAAAITYLDQATSKLGAANAKILYLKIMALQALAQEDEVNLEPLKKAIAAFEKSPDFESFNEEKQLEIMKLKLKLANGGLERSVGALEASAYSKLGITGWQVGVKLEEMKRAHSDFFSQAKRTDMGDTVSVYQSTGKPMLQVVANKGIITSVYRLLYDAADNSSFTAGTTVFQDIKNTFGGSPEEKVNRTVSDVKWFGFIMTQKTVTWKEKNIQVSTLFMTNDSKNYKKPNTFSSSVGLWVAYTPK